MEIEIDDHVMMGKKRIALNLNVYRNLHHQVNNKAKKIFKQQLVYKYPELRVLRSPHLQVEYIIIPNDKRKFDIMNIISVVDKYFLDSLVDIGCIPDDNYTIVTYKSPQVLKIQKNKCKKILIKCNFF